MKAVYNYITYKKYGNQKSRAVLSSFGAALAMARHDLEYAQRLYEPLGIIAEGMRYELDDILRLTDLDCKGGIIVKLPVSLR